MEIINSNPAFTAKNPHIRFADDIARRVNQAYPRLSSTKYEGLKHSAEFEPIIKGLMSRIKEMREDLFFSMLNASGNYIMKCLALTEVMASEKIGNCHESAILAEIAAKANGIKNCFIAQLKPNTDNLTDTHDHAVLYVDTSKHPYIIDPWLGFADFVPNAIERYRKEFSNYFDFGKFGTEEMHFDMLSKKNSVTAETEKILEAKFPELLINKG